MYVYILSNIDTVHRKESLLLVIFIRILFSKLRTCNLISRCDDILCIFHRFKIVFSQNHNFCIIVRTVRCFFKTCSNSLLNDRKNSVTIIKLK